MKKHTTSKNKRKKDEENDCAKPTEAKHDEEYTKRDRWEEKGLWGN